MGITRSKISFVCPLVLAEVPAPNIWIYLGKNMTFPVNFPLNLSMVTSLFYVQLEGKPACPLRNEFQLQMFNFSSTMVVLFLTNGEVGSPL